MARASPPSWVCRLPPMTMDAPACAPSPPCWLVLSPSLSTTCVHGKMSPSTFWTAYVRRQGEPQLQRLEARRRAGDPHATRLVEIGAVVSSRSRFHKTLAGPDGLRARLRDRRHGAASRRRAGAEGNAGADGP